MKGRFSVRLLRILLLLAGLFLAVLWYFSLRDYSGYFRSRKGVLADVGRQFVSANSAEEKSSISLQNGDGFRVDCGILTPRQDTNAGFAPAKRFPAFIVLGGKATGKYAVDYALGIKDVIVIAPDYPYTPRESYTVTEFLRDVPDMREALLDMVPAVMLVMDYLWLRNDVDTTKIVLVGYSFGAPFIPCIVAHDPRVAAAAMVYGGGGLRSLITHNVRRYEGALVSEGVGVLGGFLLRPLEPMRYIDQVAPIPLIMINGAQDEMIPRENVELLYNAAREPKHLVWLESSHVNPGKPALTKLIIENLALELARLHILETPVPR